MTKEQWQDLYNRLGDISAEFNYNHSQAAHGKNITIRESAKRRAEHHMIVAKGLLNNNPEALELLTKGATGTSEAFILDEFNQPQYFGSDISEILRAIRAKIDEL